MYMNAHFAYDDHRGTHAPTRMEDPSVPEADGVDADGAVAGARAAFEGPWGRLKPRDRQALLRAFADAVQEHYDELRLLEAVDMGFPVGRRRGKSLIRAQCR
jgi:acyl-CoA reductase-like NAD-dependent aldehyde dehydrogenase